MGGLAAWQRRSAGAGLRLAKLTSVRRMQLLREVLLGDPGGHAVLREWTPACHRPHVSVQP